MKIELNIKEIIFDELNYGEIFITEDNKVYMKIVPIADKNGEILGNAIEMENGYLQDFFERATIIPRKNAKLIV